MSKSMETLKRFTTQYKSAEDRILLTGEDRNGETVSLWLTQRLLLKAVPVLVDWLQKNNPVDLTTTDNSAQAKEMAQVFSRKPVQAKSINAATGDSPETAPVEVQESPMLVHSIDLNLKQKVLRLRFCQDNRELGNLALNSSQLRQWLAVIHVLWKNAGWPSHVWPQWLKDDTKLVTNQTRGAFH